MTDTPVIHLHKPAGGTYCGAPRPADPARELTAYRSEATCSVCLLLVHPEFGAEFREYLRTHPRPADCTCVPYGGHTDDVDAAIPTTEIEAWLPTERCPAERRALARIIASR